MTDDRPVIFLAFANDRDPRVPEKYLRNLPEEARRLRETMEQAEREGLCEVVLRQNTTLSEVVDIFQEYRNRIAIFHFGGHASSYSLQFESPAGAAAPAQGEGLADLLRHQRGLGLVFLNGCSTGEQARSLMDASVPAVIATARAIDDGIATEFADRFYKGLVTGADLRTAYGEAVAAIRMQGQGDPQSLYDRRALTWLGESEASTAGRWPWQLYPPEEQDAGATRWALSPASPVSGPPARRQASQPGRVAARPGVRTLLAGAVIAVILAVVVYLGFLRLSDARAPAALPPPAILTPPVPSSTFGGGAVPAPPLANTKDTPAPTSVPAGSIVPSSVGQTWTRPADGMVMVSVPAGELQMGSTPGQIDQAFDECNRAGASCQRESFEAEGPLRAANPGAFWIDKTEVTNAQFARFQEATGYQTDAEEAGTGWTLEGSQWAEIRGASWQHPGGPGTDLSGRDRHPAVQISWNDAEAYCQWAGVRLPTQTEWEYAARGPKSSVYPWGESFDGTRLNYCDRNCELSWADRSADDGYGRTAPVGSYPAGASWVGAMDLAGNVWEWVADRGEPTAQPALDSRQVLRGGSWFDGPFYARSAFRDWNSAGYWGGSNGFRCARSQ